MKVVVGSKNSTKVNAVKTHFPELEVIAHVVASGVAAQPIGDEETLQGALHRAKQAYDLSAGGIGIGLEGGIMCMHNQLYLCSWGAMVTNEGSYTASGARIVLPSSFKTPLLREGKELSEVMERYTKKKDIRSKEGAIGIFTDGLVLREELFDHVVALLKGQMSYWQK